jgi:hypothetical protein
MANIPVEPAATRQHVRGRAYDLDYRDQPGEDLTAAPISTDPTARGPP